MAWGRWPPARPPARRPCPSPLQKSSRVLINCAACLVLQDDQAKLEQWLKEVAWQASEREGMETQRRQAREAAFQADLQAQSADQQLLQAQQRALELALQRAAHAEQTAARYSRELQEEKSESDQLAAQLKIQVR